MAPAPYSERITTTIRAAATWLPLTLAIAVAPGLAVWPLAHLAELDHWRANQLDTDLRYDQLAAMVISVACVLAFYAGAHLRLRKFGGTGSFASTCRELNRYTFVTLAAPLLTAFVHPGLETGHRFFTLTLAAIITALIGTVVYRGLELTHAGAGLAGTMPTPRTRIYPSDWMLVVGVALGYTGYVSYLAVLDHHNLGTHIYDLGIYDNIVWNTTFDDFLGCAYCKLGKHVSAHFDPAVGLVTPFYRLFPRAETLLVFQTAWLSTGVFPLFLMAQRNLENPRLAALFCLAYALYPALHGVNMFDFHSLTLVVPTVMWIIYFIDTGAKIPLWIALAVMVGTREDMPLLACFLGAYAVLRGRGVTGLVMVAVSLTYLAFVKLVVMPDSSLLMEQAGTENYAYFFAEMIPNEEGLRGFVVSLLTNPVFALEIFLREERIFLFLVLLMPLLFLPLLAGTKRFIMLYGLVFLGLATRTHVYSLHFQYTSVLFPVLLMSTPDGLVRLLRSRWTEVFGLDRRRLPVALMWMIFTSSLLLSVKYGVMIPNEHFKAGWNRLSRRPHPERYQFLRELVAQIPAEAGVCASSALGPHVSNRDQVSKWPSCRDSEYALLHTGLFKKKSKDRVERAVKRGDYERIDGGFDIELFKLKVTEAMRQRAAEERDRFDAILEGENEDVE